MNKINKTSKYIVNCGLIIVAILGLISILTPNQASAACVSSNGRYCIFYKSNTPQPTVAPQEPVTSPVDTYNGGGSTPPSVISNSNSGTNVPVSNVPSIFSVSPNYLKPGSGSQVITVNGSNFIPSSIVRWNGSDRDTTYLNQNTLQARLTDADLSNRGEYLITVYNPVAGGGFSNAIVFAVGDSAAVSGIGITPSVSTTGVDNKNLEARAGGASSGFFPGSIIGWLLLIILILVIVLIWRRIYVNEAKKKKKQEEMEKNNNSNHPLKFA